MSTVNIDKDWQRKPQNQPQIRKEVDFGDCLTTKYRAQDPGDNEGKERTGRGLPLSSP